jgi:hypothetical protein
MLQRNPVFTSSPPKVRVTNRERDARLNRERVKAHYRRRSGRNKAAIYPVEGSEMNVSGLIRLGYLDEAEAKDRAAVAAAIKLLLDIATRNS